VRPQPEGGEVGSGGLNAGEPAAPVEEKAVVAAGLPVDHRREIFD
jgi:hypothetical protein